MEGRLLPAGRQESGGCVLSHCLLSQAAASHKLSLSSGTVFGSPTSESFVYLFFNDFLNIFIGVELLYNGVLVSAV